MIFKEVTVEDGQWAKPLLEKNGYRSCEYNFVDIYMWSDVNRTRIARFEDFVMVRSQDTGRPEQLLYLYPSGEGDVKTAVEAILKDAMEAGKQPVIFSIPEEKVEELRALFPHFFDYTNPRSQTDYVYSAQDLAELKGKKFQKKRNHCSRFERTYPDWQFLEIGPESMQAIRDFNNRWCNLYDNRDDTGIMIEHKAIEKALRHYEALGLKGGYVTVAGEVVAFSFGSQLGSDMFVTHVEKALYDVTGAYNIINREMARHFCSGYAYINRENDVGEEGLREAKLSYNPLFLVDKYRATPRKWPMKEE